jgi:dTDP-4-dehydrorhamnose reductase
MKVLVLGSRGMAGHIITKYLTEQGYIVDTMARDNAKFCLNIEKTNEVKTFFQDIKHNYDYIINCIGLLVKDSNERPDRATLINSWFPHMVEYSLKDSKTKLIHLSTDCVFDGARGPYTENDIHTEKNSYGKSKSLGEVNNEKDITFRMSIIGTEIKENGTGLMNWVLRNTQKELPGWDNALWNGITTLELAKCIDKFMNSPKISGVYHLVNNNNSINKFDLLCLINDVFELKKTILRTQGPKPINKVLIDTRQEFDFEIGDYKTQLVDLKKFNNV